MPSSRFREVTASNDVRSVARPEPIDETNADPHHGCHQIEQEISRTLKSEPTLKFSSLVVRRIPNGVCLQGVMEVDESSPDVTSLVRKVAGVEYVINRLVVMPSASLGLPAKG